MHNYSSLSCSSAAKSAPTFRGFIKRGTAAGLLLLLLVGAAQAQLTVLPASGKYLGYVSAPEPGKWIVMSAGEFMPVPLTVLEAGKAIIFEADAGKYGVFYFPPGDAQPIVQVVVLGGATPVPPPPPPPGTRWSVIWEQTQQRTPAQAALYVNLRKQFQKDRLLILDVDQLPATWEAYRRLANPTALPALAVYADNKLVRTVPLPSSVDGVILEVAR